MRWRCKAPESAETSTRSLVDMRDLAFAQSSPQMFGYKRAAAAIFALDAPLTDFVEPDGAWPKIPGIGTGSARVIREVLETGGSPTAEQAIEASDRHADIQRRRQLRQHFLSRAEVRRILSDPSFAVPTTEQYLGDMQMHSNGASPMPLMDRRRSHNRHVTGARIGQTDTRG
jgi:hypothetical protein